MKLSFVADASTAVGRAADGCERGHRLGYGPDMNLSVRGLTFDVTVAGDPGGAPVLLLHGFPQNATMWGRVAPMLHLAGRTTVAPDQRGYARGARPLDVDAYRIGEPVADAVAILDALDIERVDVVGHDWGALVAWHLAAAHPERVRTLTAVSVPHPVAMGTAVATDTDQRQRSAYMGFFRQTGTAEEALLAEHGARLRAVFDGCPPEYVDGYVKPLLEPGALTGALNWYRAMSPETMVCGPVDVPTTFVWGNRDIAIGRIAARSCADHVGTDYRFVELDASHWVPDEMPEKLAVEILDRAAGA